MDKLAVIGAGTMGHSIALAAAWHGQRTEVYGVDELDVERAKQGFRAKLTLMEENGLLTKGQTEEVGARLKFSTSLEETVADAEFIIEAIPENIKLKHKLYRQLEGVVDEAVVIASNSSGLMPTLLAEEMKHPERFVLTHFWNPAHLVPLVEIVAGEKTAGETMEKAQEVIRRMHKKPVLVKKELPGFLGNRLQFALFREAQALLDANVASKEDIDAAVTYSIGRRLPVTGPLETADLGGLDIFHAISSYLFEDLSSAKAPGHTLDALVDKGELGEKSGRGFYDWPQERSRAVQTKREETLIHFLKQELNE